MYFRWYCEELIRHGYLKRIDREHQKFSVLPEQKHKRENHFKTKENTLEEFVLLQPITYTYDYRLIWTEKAYYIFTELYVPDGHFVFGIPTFVSHKINVDGIDEIVSYVDVKPHFAAAAFGGGKNASYYSFPYIQKFLLWTRKLYINKIIPIHTGKHGVSTCLFATTFVPNSYKFTDKSGALRTIPYRQRSITSYCNQRQAIIDGIMKEKQVKDSKNSQQKLL
jgi:hypothetical protein